MEKLNTYQIFVTDDIKSMYVIRAAYFKADEIGVMFFDSKNSGIAFVPSDALYLVRQVKEEDSNEEDSNKIR